VLQNGAVTLGGLGDLSRITPSKPFAPSGGPNESLIKTISPGRYPEDFPYYIYSQKKWPRLLDLSHLCLFEGVG